MLLQIKMTQNLFNSKMFLNQTYIHRTRMCLCRKNYSNIKNASLLSNSKISNNHYITTSHSYHSLSSNNFNRNNIIKCHQDVQGSVILRKLSSSTVEGVAVIQSSWFQALSNSNVVQQVMSGLQAFHDTSQLPWWATIVISTVILRLSITLPLSIYQGYIFAKLELIGHELAKLIPELKKETSYAVKKFQWDKKYTLYMYNRSLRKLKNEMIIKHNCHPFKATLLLWFQLPLWVILSMSLRNLTTMMPLQDATAQLIYMEMSVGGFGWIPNLTIPDASLILPVSMAIFNLINIQISVMNRTGASTRVQSIMTNMFRGLSLVFIPIGMYLPTGVTLYWTVSSFYSILQNLLLLNPKFRQWCRIPNTPSQRERPYKHLWDSSINNKFK